MTAAVRPKPRIVARKWRGVRGRSLAALAVQRDCKALRRAQASPTPRREDISSRLRTAQRPAGTAKFKRGLSHGVRDLCRRCCEIPVLVRGDIGEGHAIELGALHVAAALAHELSAIVTGAHVLAQAQTGFLQEG